MRDDIKKAMDLLRREGYAVIPREKILRLCASDTISNRALYEHGNNPNFLKTFLESAFHGMAHRMQADNVCSIRSESEDFERTRYTITAQIIPHEIETDPILEMMRECR